VSSPQRLGAPLAAVPTWMEQGVNGTMTNFRAVIAPRGTPAGPVAFWERRFAQLAETDEWKADLNNNLWSWNFMDSAKTVATVATHAEDVDALVNTLGLRKAP
jgi:putative tricarboxylic transport membrane protein